MADLAQALMVLDGVAVVSDDGKRTEVFSGGMMESRHFVAFTPAEASKNFALHWAKNPPVALRK